MGTKTRQTIDVSKKFNFSSYSTALVQHCEYECVTHMVATCGAHVYSHDTQFTSNMRVFNPCLPTSYSYTACIVITHA